MTPDPLNAEWLLTAHADAWEQHARLRAGSGGAATRVPGARLMATGLRHPQWNSADVTDAAMVDLAELRQWYAVRGVPWGVRVPAEQSWSVGRLVVSQTLMGLPLESFLPADRLPAGLELRRAGSADLEQVLAVDAAAFGPDPLVRRWIAPLLDHPSASYALVERVGEPVGTAYALRSDGDAGQCVYLAGVGVIPAFRRRGIAAAMSSWLLADAFAAGAALGHLHPDTPEAARVYARLGFTPAAALNIYVGC